jgi:hypothetical protein
VDIERTIEFILENQANTDVRIAGISKLLLQGMRMLTKTDTRLAQLTGAQKELAQAQKRTDRTLAAVP